MIFSPLKGGCIQDRLRVGDDFRLDPGIQLFPGKGAFFDFPLKIIAVTLRLSDDLSVMSAVTLRIFL